MAPPHSPVETGQLHFWAESALAPQPPRYKRSDKRIYAHPFCVTAKELRQILLPLTNATVKPQNNSVELLLPTTLNGPQPSLGLLYNWRFDGRSKITLTRWRIEIWRIMNESR